MHNSEFSAFPEVVTTVYIKCLIQFYYCFCRRNRFFFLILNYITLNNTKLRGNGKKTKLHI